jgi:hypothetical protein
MALPQGGTFQLELNLHRHQIMLSTSTGDEHRLDMTDGMTATEMANHVLGAVADLGPTADYDRQRFDNEQPRVYDPAAVLPWPGLQDRFTDTAGVTECPPGDRPRYLDTMSF